MKKKLGVVCPKVAGTYSCKPGDVSKALGPTTFQVWLGYIWRRNFDGVSFATSNTIANAKGLSRQQVLRACNKLTKVGLIKNLGWVECDHFSDKKKRYARIIYGDYRSKNINVPAVLKERVFELPTRGGKREGAGRKKKIKPHTNPNQTDHHININMNNNVSYTRNKGASKLRQDVLELLRDIPYPSISQAGVAKIPPPPKIPEEDCSTLEQVNILSVAYRKGIAARYKKKCYAFSRGDIQKSKHWNVLTSAVDLFIEYDISPISWVTWSIDKWLEGYSYEKSDPSKKFPPVGWVFSASRITKHKGWFGREVNNYSGGKLYYTTQHKKLFRKYDGLRREAFQALELPDDVMVSARSLEQKWFPHGWEEAYSQAKRAAAKTQQKIDELVRGGEYVW